MNASDLETTLRSVPPWLLISIAGLLVLLLIAAGPFAGWCLERRRTAPARAFTRAAAAKWIETGEINLEELRAEERAKLKLQRRTGGDSYETIEGIRLRNGISMPFEEATEPEGSRVQVIRDDRPTSIITVVDNSFSTVTIERDGEIFLGFDGATKPITKPAWAEEPTQGWEIQEPAANVFDAEIMADDDDGLTEAERQFLADPLGSWLLPPLDEYDFLPTADEAVSFLLQADLLTGEGMDIDAEWASWNLYEGANA